MRRKKGYLQTVIESSKCFPLYQREIGELDCAQMARLKRQPNEELG